MLIDFLSVPFILALLLCVGLIAQWLGWRLQLPAILFLLLVGIVLGPITGALNPDVLLGDLLFPFVSMGVAIILFEGSLTLKFAEVRGVTSYIRNLTTLGVMITWFVMAAAAHYIGGLSWSIAFLFGALVSVTGPTVIIPMLRSLKTTQRVANVLRWEGIIVDPIGALLAVLVYEFIISQGHGSNSFEAFILLVGSGTLLGGIGALFMGQVLKRHLIPDYLTNLFSLAVVLTVFTGANEIEHESGLVAVTVMGMMLANMKGVNIHSILDFKEHLTVLLISVLFILLAARMDLSIIITMGWSALLILLVAQFIARPLSVFAAKIGTDLSFKELLLLSWISPRGIVAAAVSALFAIRLTEQGIEGADALVPLVFVMIIGTVVLQSATASFVAKRLGLSMKGAQGVMITGANRVSIAVGVALQKQGFNVMIADDSRAAINDARMKGLVTYYGNVLGDQADIHLDLSGYSHMLMMGRKSELNPLYFAQFRPSFGPNRIFSLTNSNHEEDAQAGRLGYSAQVMFGETISWSKLSSLISKGAEIRFTSLTDTFTYDDYVDKWGKNALALFAINPKGGLVIITRDLLEDIAQGWQIGALVMEDNHKAAEKLEKKKTKAKEKAREKIKIQPNSHGEEEL